MLEFSRRNVLIGGAALLGVTVMATKPRDRSGPRDPYFDQMQTALMNAGIATPTLVIDRMRLNANVDALMSHLPQKMGYRVVAKSLPSPALIEHVCERSGTDRLMTFNLPMLSELSEMMPEAGQLLGKPLPVQAARRYFDVLPSGAEGAKANVQWLIDTPERYTQYASLANELGQDLRLNIELDVGLHRGGFVPGDSLGVVLEQIKANPRANFAGFMGYEPHIPSLPTDSWRDAALKGAWKIYSEALAQAQSIFDAETMNHITRNAAGSPTYRYYHDTEVANEVSAGSCLVKPTHFDTDLLEPHQPASFIATPVIKSLPTTRLPGMEFATGAQRAWNPNHDKTLFIYGGHWLADPVDPPGLSLNSIFGRSSNQEMLNGGPELDIQPDEFVFFRPHQSEAVFLQFGDIAVYEDGAIVDMWPVFPASA